jgi:hypothetical protein
LLLIRHSCRQCWHIVNSPFTESNAVLSSDNTLYFVSFQKKAPIVQDGKDQDYHAKIYTSAKTKDGKWGKPVALSDAINRPNVHSGHITLSPDGETMVFTRSLLVSNEVSETKMYVSEKDASGWAPPEIKLPTGIFKWYPALAKMSTDVSCIL